MSYFNFEPNPRMAFGLRHHLNKKYKGSRSFEIQAPDAAGTLVVWARDEEEADEHIQNALFELIFHRNRCGAFVTNPKCIFCGARTESRGRNSSGTRVWRCLGDCRRSFTLNREWRGGIHSPVQSKKPAFHRLVFVEGKSIREAVEALGISHNAADNWYRKMAALRAADELPKCPCGKAMRHRGTCLFRQQFHGNITALTLEQRGLKARRAEGGR